MGWASGSTLFSKVIEVIEANVAGQKSREEIYKGLIEAFEEADCDTLDECLGDDPAFDAAYLLRGEGLTA